MDGNTERAVDGGNLQVDPLPERLNGGSTVLVASPGVPSQFAVGLRILHTEGAAADTALVVTTTESADRTIAVYDGLDGESDRPSLGLVDTTSEQQSVSAIYGETPVVFTPSPGDLERLVLALSDLTATPNPAGAARHLVIRSLTPIIAASSTTRVRTVLQRITGLRSESGLCLIGIDYTAHDEETMTAVADLVDGVLWVTQSASDRLTFEFRSSGRRRSRSVPGGGADD